MESDLALLPIYLAESSDYLLINEEPSSKFHNYLNRLEINVPNIISKQSLVHFSKSPFDIEKLLPWGWSPAEHTILKPLKKYCSDSFKHSPIFNWKDEYRHLYSKKFALQILQQLIVENDFTDVIKTEMIGRVCFSKSEIEALLRKWNNLMIKAPWSSSGRGLQPVTKVPVHDKVWEKILGIINDQGCVLVEPLLNKTFDLAFQFKLEKEKISYLGISHFTTDKKGQYQGNYLNGLPDELSYELKDFLSRIPDLILPSLIKILEQSELAKKYEGNFGVDTLIFWDNDFKLRINPCLEINVRQNMGLLSLQIEKLISPEEKGIFQMYYNPKKSFTEFVREMESKFPLAILNQKIKKGFFPLTDFSPNKMFGAYIFVP